MALFSVDIHFVKAEDVRIRARHKDTVQWITFSVGDGHEITLFAASIEDFYRICKLLQVEPQLIKEPTT